MGSQPFVEDFIIELPRRPGVVSLPLFLIAGMETDLTLARVRRRYVR